MERPRAPKINLSANMPEYQEFGVWNGKTDCPAVRIGRSWALEGKRNQPGAAHHRLRDELRGQGKNAVLFSYRFYDRTK
jgi:hypothetical protein